MDPDLFSTPYLWLWKGCGKYLCSSLFHQVIHIVHKPPVVYSSVLRPLQPKASLWTGSTPWSWARWACCRLPHSPLWAPHRVSTAESDSPAGCLLSSVTVVRISCTGTSYISSSQASQVFQIWNFFFWQIMKNELEEVPDRKKRGRSRKSIKPQGRIQNLTSTRNIASIQALLPIVLCILTKTKTAAVQIVWKRGEILSYYLDLTFICHLGRLASI